MEPSLRPAAKAASEEHLAVERLSKWNRLRIKQIEWYKTSSERITLMKKQGLLYGSFILMLSVIISRVAGLIFKIPLTNILGGTGMGYFQSAYTVFTPIYSICAMSLPPAISTLVAESTAFARYKNIRSIKKTALIAFSIISLILTLIPIIFADFIATRIIGNSLSAPAIAAISPCIFFGTLTAVYRGYFEGLKNMTPTAISQIVESVVRTVCGLGFAYYASVQLGGINDFTTPVIAAAAILGVTVADLLGLVYIIIWYRLLGDGISKNDLLHSDPAQSIKTTLKQLVILMIPMTISSVVSSLMNAVDLSTIMLCIKSSLRNRPELYVQKYVEIISSGTSLEELPNFLYGSFTGLAMTVFSLAPSLCSVFGKSALPNISEAYAIGDKKRVEKEIIRVISIVSLISVPAGFGLSVMSEEILFILFSNRQLEISVCVLPLAIISLSTPFLAISISVYSMLQAVGKQTVPVKITLIGAIVKLSLNTVLVPITSLGLSGAAISTSISYVVMCIASICILFKHTRINAKSIYTPLLSIVGGALSSISAKTCLNLLQCYHKSALNVIISIAFAVIIYIIAVMLLDKSTKNKLVAEIFK